MNRETAQKIMQLWKENGITEDSEELRKLYIQRGNASLARFGFQLFLDAIACYAVRPAFQPSPHHSQSIQSRYLFRFVAYIPRRCPRVAGSGSPGHVYSHAVNENHNRQ